MISLLSIGIDFTGAYTALVLGKPYRLPRWRPARPPDAEAPVLPFTLYDAASGASLREVWRLAAAFATVCWRGPGLRYAAPISIKVIGILMLRLLRHLATAAARKGGDAPPRHAGKQETRFSG
jgi:hypothetical protein